MTIDPNSLRTTQTGVQPSSAEKAQQRRVEALYAGRSEQKSPSRETDPSSDRAQISELSRNLRQLTAESPERTAHLERVSNDVQTRRYQVDPHVVSERIIEDTLRASL